MKVQTPSFVMINRLIRRLSSQIMQRKADAPVLDASVTSLDVLKKAGEATAILGALFYVVGWSSLQGYYTAFGLNLAQMQISMLDGTTASLRIFFHDFVSLVVLLSIPVFGMVVRQFHSRFAQDPIAVSLILIFLVAGALCLRAGAIGKRDAWRDMVGASTRLPRVQIELDPAKNLNGDIVKPAEFREPYYVLLMQTADKIWMFEPLQDWEGA